MEQQTPPSWVSSGASRFAVACGRLRLPRSPWPYVAVAVALLVASQLLWRWHSWPARQILDTEPRITEPST